LSAADEIEKRVSWHQGLLAFENDSLETVVAEVGRYTTLRIISPERSTREIKVGGLFKAGDTEALFEALKDGFNLHVEKVSDDVVYLISSKNR
jgi:transmembrane sensor